MKLTEMEQMILKNARTFGLRTFPSEAERVRIQGLIAQEWAALSPSERKERHEAAVRRRKDAEITQRDQLAYIQERALRDIWRQRRAKVAA